jgi:hypothetical protein
MRFQVNNAERMRIDSSGNVGIGVSDPDATLDISGGSNKLGILRVTQRASGAAAYGLDVGLDPTLGDPVFSRIVNDTVTEVFRIQRSSGNVGINNTSPNTKLDIIGSSTNGSGVVDTLRLRNTGTSVNDGPRLQFTSGTSTSGAAIGSQGKALNSADLLFYAGGNNERMRIDNSGNVGIGTTSPSEKLVLANGSNEIKFGLDGSSHDIFSNGKTFNIGTTDGTVVRFFENNSEAMRLSGGNLLVGKTATDSGTVGFEVAQDGHVYVTVNNTLPFYINRQSGSELQRFASNGTTVGSIKTYNSTVQYGGAAAAIYLDTAAFLPANASGRTDNTIDLGNGSYRYNDVFATNGTIQTSDRNEKQDIAELTDAEQRVAVVAKGLLRKFRWIDAVEEKGDEARTHFGIIAQDLQAAFADEGLDAGDYAMFTSSTWTDEDTGEERTRMGVRYSELLAFIIAAI